MKISRRTIALGALLLLGFGASVLRFPAPPPPSPTPAHRATPDAFDFAVFGDAPYHPWEELQYDVVLKDLNAHELEFVIHVGDIFWRPCTDTMYRQALDRFNSVRHPVMYTPGDNEWTDCWQRAPGAWAPLDRLERIRAILFSEPDRSLGGRNRPLESQGGSQAFPEFVENVRWWQNGFVFATLHLVGSRNGTEPFAKRTPADDEASRQRTLAAVAWMRETFAAADSLDATGIVLAFHANPGFEEPATDDYRQSYDPWIEALEDAAAAFPGPILIAQGDHHEYLVDRPLVHRRTGQRLENVRRLQVSGSPEVGWVRVTVTPGAPEPFSFENRVVPRWKYW